MKTRLRSFCPRLERLESREAPAVRLFDNGVIAVVADTRAEIREPAVPLYYQGVHRGDFQVLELYQRVAGTSSFPLVAVDILANGYSRMTTQKADGSSGSLGASLLGSLSIRSAGTFHYVPSIEQASLFVEKNVVTVRLTGSLGGAGTEVITYQHALASVGRTVTTGSIQFTTNQAIALEPSLQGKDALRLFTLSTMYTDNGEWDSSVTQFSDQYGATQQLHLGETAGDNHLFSTPQRLQSGSPWIRAIKEPGSQWYPDSPSLQVQVTSATVTRPGEPARALALGMQGWRQASNDPNDDSVNLWPEVLDGVAVLPAGTGYSVRFQATATPPRAMNGPLAPPVLLSPGSRIADATPTLTWTPMLGASRYELLVRNLTTGGNVVVHPVNLTTAGYTVLRALREGTYRAWVRVIDGGGRVSGWSTARTFQIVIPQPGRVTLRTPVGAVGDATPTFTWSRVAYGHVYHLVVRDMTAGGKTVIDRWVRGETYTAQGAMPPHGYRWQVRAVNEVGEAGAWSVVGAFSVRRNVLRDLATTRHWITYAPRQFNPNVGRYPTQAEIRADLELLYREGWRGIMTWSLDGSLRYVPRIARSVGFDYVVAGIYYYDRAQLERERSAALAEKRWIDAFVVGNEGLQFGPRYSEEELAAAMASLRAATGKPVGTCETGGYLLSHPRLLALGDFALANIHPWYAGQREVEAAVQHTVNEYAALVAQAPEGKLVYIRESWWPTSGGDGAASQVNQVEYYRRLASTGIPFAWGEAFDQPWKTSEPLWGLHHSNGVAKSVIRELSSLYRDVRP